MFKCGSCYAIADLSVPHLQLVFGAELLAIAELVIVYLLFQSYKIDDQIVLCFVFNETNVLLVLIIRRAVEVGMVRQNIVKFE